MTTRTIGSRRPFRTASHFLPPVLLLGMTILAAVPYSVAAEYHVNNSVACSDSNPGSPSQPLCRIQAGLDRIAAAGDIVTIHEGTYLECATYNKYLVDGTATDPIVIRGAPGEDPNRIIIDASGLTQSQCPEPAHGQCMNSDYGVRAALTIKGGYSDPLRFVRVQDMTVRPTRFEDPGSTGCGAPLGCRHNYGLDIQCVTDAEVLGIRSDDHPAFTATAGGAEASGDAILNLLRAQRVLVQGADFSHGGVIVPGFHPFAVWGGSRDVWITESHVRDFPSGLVVHSGGCTGTVLTFNDVHNMEDATDGDNTIQIYNVDNVRVAYNRIYDHKYRVATVRAYTYSSERPRVVFHSNYFKARSSRQTAVTIGYSASENMMRLVMARNNLFEGYGRAWEFLEPSIYQCRFLEDYNAYYEVPTTIADNDSTCAYGAVGPGSIVLSSDPLDPNDCPVAGSPIVDAGDPSSPVPVGGGSVADIGACESGAPAGAWVTPYDLQPIDASSSATPRITWDGASDFHVNMQDLDFVEFLEGAPQNSYRCQVDTVYTFNSQGIGSPLWDSGVVRSANRYCDTGRFLPNGAYWGRVRLNSDQIWSFPFKFTVLADTAAPQPPPNVRVAP